MDQDQVKNIALIRNLIDPEKEYAVPVKENVREIMLRVTGLDITV